MQRPGVEVLLEKTRPGDMIGFATQAEEAGLRIVSIGQSGLLGKHNSDAALADRIGEGPWRCI